MQPESAPLSRSSRKALRFAWAAAEERTGQPTGPELAGAAVDSWDLLVGILLAHPGDSEAELTFRHLGLVAGQALPADYPTLSVEGLNSRLATLPAQLDPTFGADVETLVRTAGEIAASIRDDGLIELRALWVAILLGPSAVTDRLRTLLAQRGVDLARLASASREWIGQSSGSLTSEQASAAGDGRTKVGYEKVLEQFRSGPVIVINYKADQPSRGEKGAEQPSDDFIGIGPEVDAFAYLMASHSLEPPLAIGLFGDWGSGKSYFMNAIRWRIDQLLKSKQVQSSDQRDIPFWKRIVQVEFNAWHYVDGDLWSSLVDHIFTQLNLASERVTDNAVEKRRSYYLAQLKETSESLKELEEQRQVAEEKLNQQQTEKAKLEEEHRKAQQAFAEAQDRKIVEQRIKESRTEVASALKAVQIGSDVSSLTIGAALDILTSARQELLRGNSLFRQILTDRSFTIKLIFFTALAVLVPFAIERVTSSGIVAAFAGVASFLAALTGPLASATSLVKSQLDAIDQAKASVFQEAEQEEAARRAQIELAVQQLEATTKEIDKIAVEEAALQEKVATLTLALDKGPSEVLHEFLRSRLEAGEYRKRLGVPAIIRQDFSSLADLIKYQNEFLLTPERERDAIKEKVRKQTDHELLEDADDRIINRIVLYIDDLDRCSDEQVVKVLQAVHLLLAFPLFVVVVAVDSRWLAHALRTHFPALTGGISQNGEGSAEPQDYLEKIFQVPFRVRELNEASRSRIVRGLLGRHVHIESVASEAQSNNGVQIGDREATVLKEMLEPRSAPPVFAATALAMTRDELAFLDRLAPLLGNTPRAIKRFVNVYQLLKILRLSRAASESDFPPDNEIAAFLLAIEESLPRLSREIINEASNYPGLTLDALLALPRITSCSAELDRLNAWFSEGNNAVWRQVASERLAEVALDVRRFLFHDSYQGQASVLSLPELLPAAPEPPEQLSQTGDSAEAVVSTG